MSNIDQNVSPYFNDFDEEKNFFHVLFKPGAVVQARELNQLQSILQNQVTKSSNFLLDDGSVVYGGMPSYNNLSCRYIRLADSSGDVSSAVGKVVTGDTSGASGLVVAYSNAEANDVYTNVNDPATLYVNMINDKSFTSGESLTISGLSLSVRTESPVADQGYEPFGRCALASVSRGIYYVDGYFVVVSDQTIVASKYNTIPSIRIGLTISHSIVTATDDSSLYDNALGYPNQLAPGADRMKISLTLSKKPIAGGLDSVEYGTSDSQTDSQISSDVDFIEIMRVVDGKIVNAIKYPDLGELENTLARRTFDESGNYTVRPWSLNIEDSTSGDTLSYNLGPGKGYVKGYEFETDYDRSISVSKARTSDHINQVDQKSFSANIGNFIYVTDLKGHFDVDTPGYIQFHNVALSSIDWRENNAADSPAFSCSIIGTARVSSVVPVENPAGDPYYYKVYLFGVKFRSGYTLNDALSITSCYDSSGSFITGNFDDSTDGDANILEPSGDQVILGRANISSTNASGTTDILNFQDRVFNNLLIPIPYGNIKSVVENDSGDLDVVFDFWALQSNKLVNIGRSVAITTIPLGPNVNFKGESPLPLNFVVTDATTVPSTSGDQGMGEVLDDVAIAFADPNQCVISNIPYTNGDAVTITHVDILAKYTYSTGASHPRAKSLTKCTKVEFTGTSGDASTNKTQGNHDILGVSDVYSLDAVYWADPNNSTAYPPSVILQNPVSGTFIVGETVTSTSGTGKVLSYNAGTLELELATSYTFSVNDTITGADSGALGMVSTPNDSTARTVGSDSTTRAGDREVSSYYTLDNGQRNNYYDWGSIILNDDAPTPTGNMVAYVSHFTDSTANDGYLVVDSYSGAVTYDNIPTYYSEDGGSTFHLQDYFDFRPRRSDYPTSGDSPSYREISNIYWDGSAWVPNVYATTLNSMRIPDPNSSIVADYQHYIPRIDKIVATKDKAFKVLRGTPALNPVSPPDEKDSMTLYTIKVPAYTFDISDCEITYIENKRYTMRDIGRLEKRIENIEYYTSLNALEQEAKAQTVIDPNGIDRLKTSMLVDTFDGHAIGDVRNHDYKCSIDAERGELRPSFDLGVINFDLIPTSSTDGDYYSSNVKQTGDFITLDYTETPVVSQPLSSTSAKANPFDVRKYIGVVNITPDVDTFFDVETRPDISLNTNGVNDNYVSIGIDSNDTRNPGFGTKWNEESKIWAGVYTQDHVEVFGGKDSKSSSANSNSSRYDVNRDTPSSTESQTKRNINKSLGSDRIEVSSGNKVIDKNITPKNRAATLSFSVKGMKPNTTVYAFLDGSALTTVPSTITTDSSGSATGQVVIPAGAHRTGNKTFRLIDSSSNDANSATTLAETNYLAVGFLDNDDNRIVSTRPPIIRREHVAQTNLNQDVTNRSRVEGTVNKTTTVDGIEVYVRAGEDSTEKSYQTVVSKNPTTGTTTEKYLNVSSGSKVPMNPMTQTFYIDKDNYPSGYFISSVDLYFKSKDDNLPVIVSIRPVVHGYPHATKVLHGGIVAVPSSSVNTSTDGSTATTVTFDNLVYLNQGDSTSEYAIVVESDSSEYELFVSSFGGNESGTQRRITKQPNVGKFLNPQNVVEWIPDPNTSLKFTLNRAKFVTSSKGVALFNNEAVSAAKSVPVIRVGSTDGTNRGFGYPTTHRDIANGATSGDGVWNVLSTLDAYDSTGTARITVTANGSTTGDDAGSPLDFGMTVLSTSGAATSGDSFDSVFIIDAGDIYEQEPTIVVSPPGFEWTSEEDYYIGDYVFYDVGSGVYHLYVCTNDVEGPSTNPATDSGNWTDLGVTGSNWEKPVLTIPDGTMQVGVNGIDSMLVMEESLNFAETVANHYFKALEGDDLNSATEAEALTLSDNGAVASPVISYTSVVPGQKILMKSSSQQTVARKKSTSVAGSFKYKIELASGDDAVSPLIDIDRLSVITVKNNINNDSNGETDPRFGYAEAKYITRRVTLADGFDSANLSVYLSAVREVGTDIKVYAKVLESSSSELFDDQNYVEMTKVSSNVYSENDNDWKNMEFRLPDYTSATTITSGDAVYDYPDFKNYAIKIVMLSSDPTIVPKITELKAISVAGLPST